MGKYFTARYRKFWVAFTGAVLEAMVLALGPEDWRVALFSSLLIALGIGAVPNDR